MFYSVVWGKLSSSGLGGAADAAGRVVFDFGAAGDLSRCDDRRVADVAAALIYPICPACRAELGAAATPARQARDGLKRWRGAGRASTAEPRSPSRERRRRRRRR